MKIKRRKKKRITKQDIRHDPLREFVERLFARSRAYRDKVIWVLGAVALVLVVLFFRGRTTENPQAEMQLLQGISLLASGDTTNAVNVLEQLVNSYEGTLHGKKAHYYLGAYYLQKGDLEKAQKHFEAFLRSGVSDPFLRAAAQAGLAEVFLARKDYRKAAEAFRKAEALAPFQTYRALYHFKAAEALEMAGDHAEALDLLRSLKEVYKYNPLGAQVDRKIAFLEGFLEARR